MHSLVPKKAYKHWMRLFKEGQFSASASLLLPKIKDRREDKQIPKIVFAVSDRPDQLWLFIIQCTVDTASIWKGGVLRFGLISYQIWSQGPFLGPTKALEFFGTPGGPGGVPRGVIKGSKMTPFDPLMTPLGTTPGPQGPKKFRCLSWSNEGPLRPYLIRNKPKT